MAFKDPSSGKFIQPPVLSASFIAHTVRCIPDLPAVLLFHHEWMIKPVPAGASCA
jgi:hypothetical protein